MSQLKQLIDSFNSVCEELSAAGLSDSDYSIRMVNRLIELAADMRASDVHFQPSSAGLELRLRIDGVLHSCGFIPESNAQRVMARLKVMADLVHYRRDLPQEGRILVPARNQDMRISVLPTLHGEKIVLRFLSGPGHFRSIDELGYPPDVTDSLRSLLQETMGAIVVSGPAGSGKSSCLYACLRELTTDANCFRRSIASLEDPIEVAVDGVAQTQVNPSVGLDLLGGLRYLLRQDPEIIMMGEIRDRDTADAVLQASLTGHLLLTTFHAGSAAEAISRLLEMELEPYLIRSSVRAVLSQRLVRRLCSCARLCNDPNESCDLPLFEVMPSVLPHRCERKRTCGLPISEFYVPVGCEKCGGTGYAGRVALAELLKLDAGNVGKAILNKTDSRAVEIAAIEAGMIPLFERGLQAVRNGLTSPAEIRRAFGFLSDDRFLPTERHAPSVQSGVPFEAESSPLSPDGAPVELYEAVKEGEQAAVVDSDSSFDDAETAGVGGNGEQKGACACTSVEMSFVSKAEGDRDCAEELSR